MIIDSINGSVPLASVQRAEAIEAPQTREDAADAASALGSSFLDLVVEANALGRVAGQMTKRLALGQSDDIHGTMIAMNKAGIEKRLAVNVKDKVIEAFYEIWRMSL